MRLQICLVKTTMETEWIPNKTITVVRHISACGQQETTQIAVHYTLPRK